MRLSTLGLVSLLAGSLTAPAFAGTPASISGSVTFITPAGFTSTNSAESILPSGFVFAAPAPAATPITPANPATGTSATLSNAQVLVAPAYNVLGFSVATTSLSVGSSGAVTANAAANSFSSAAGVILTNSAAAVADTAAPFTVATQERATRTAGVVTYASGNIDFISAIIKAGAGVNGLD